MAVVFVQDMDYLSNHYGDGSLVCFQAGESLQQTMQPSISSTPGSSALSQSKQALCMQQAPRNVGPSIEPTGTSISA